MTWPNFVPSGNTESKKEYYRHLSAAGIWLREPDPFKLRILDEFVVGQRVADIGCATGLYVDYLTRMGKEAIGVDFVAEFLEKSTAAGKGEYVCADILSLPFAANTIDTSVAFDLLEHVDDMAALNELARVTKHRLILKLPLREPATLPSAGLVFYHHQDKTHLRTYQLEDIQSKLHHAGFRLRQFIPVGKIDFPMLVSTHIRLPGFLRRVVRRGLRTVGFQEIYTDCVVIADVGAHG